MSDLLKTLNDRQKEAVTARLGPVLVLAGAGSGKTKVLTHRIAYLIEQGKFAAQHILALTFTNKAAQSMRERIIRIMNQESGIMDQKSLNSKFIIPNSLTMGTFHSVCVRILRQDIEQLKLGYSRNFTIFDEDDTMRLMKQIVMEMGLTESFKPQVFRYYISAAKNRLILPSELHLDNEFLRETLKKVYDRYQASLREQNALDFDDLLTVTYLLFSETPAVLKKYREKFQYILVDEYQDTNHVQYMLLELLVKKHKNLFVVGDDAQSIYGFRGANMQNILDFKKDYPKARVIMLEQNYRSTKPILDVANKIIRLNPGQFEKKLWTDNAAGPKVNLYEAQSDLDEARFVVERIMNHESRIKEKETELTYVSEETPILDRFMNSKWSPRIIRNSSFVIPDDLHEQVILYRTHAQSRAFEEALLSTGIPYQIVGGIKFYERREIKDAIAYLRLTLNSRDLVSLERVINVPARGIGRVAFKTITAGLEKYDYDYNRLLNNLEALDLTAKALAGVREFFGVYAGISSPLREGELEGVITSPNPSSRGGGTEMNILDMIDYLMTRSGYKDALLADKEEGQTRWENVEELFNAAAKYKTLPWPEAVQQFLEEVALMTSLDESDATGNKLTLMTLHSAKGLEFDKVFFVGLEEGLLPHSRSLLNPGEIAEEIRLAYVGITRARKELYLTYAISRQVYGELKRSVPSRILKAIPKNLIHKIDSN